MSYVNGMYLNRDTITKINRLRRLWGIDRSSQTNSNANGSYGVVRLYELAADKGRCKRTGKRWTLDTVEAVERKLMELLG